jgi:Cft2 family RNA processing exonuclease
VRVESTPAGLFLPDVGLHVDPVLPVEAAAITHAHGDHARALPGLLYATPETAAVLRVRTGAAPATVEAACGAPVDLRRPGAAPARLTFFPAGHILGSAGVLVECGGERLFCTGDVKLRPSLTCAPAEIPECDLLVMESTFGLPVFRFPPVEALRAAILAHARAALAEGETPVFLGYALGKGPEIAKILGEGGIPTSLHGAIAKMTKVYESFGVSFPEAAPYEEGNLDGRALVVPPACRNQPIVARRRKVRVVAVTGWALLDAAYERYGAHGLVPLSDHADFDGLRRIAEVSRARRVFTVHGFAEPFSRVLALAGIDAAPLPAARPEET